MSPVSKDQTSFPSEHAQTWTKPPMSAVATYLESWLKPVQVTESLWPESGERKGMSYHLPASQQSPTQGLHWFIHLIAYTVSCHLLISLLWVWFVHACASIQMKFVEWVASLWVVGWETKIQRFNAAHGPSSQISALAYWPFPPGCALIGIPSWGRPKKSLGWPIILLADPRWPPQTLLFLISSLNYDLKLSTLRHYV